MIVSLPELTPLFQTEGDEITFSYEVAHRIMDWFNEGPTKEQAYYVEDCFVFPNEHGEWDEYSPDINGNYPLDLGFKRMPVCPECLTYYPCDCPNQTGDQK